MEGRHVPPKKKTKLWEEVKRGGGTPHGSHHCGCIPRLHGISSFLLSSEALVDRRKYAIKLCGICRIEIYYLDLVPPCK